MTEKVCQLYEEEQIGKVREGRKAIQSSKMPDLGWDATEEIEHQRKEDNTTHITEQTQEIGEIKATVPIVPETIIAIIVLILTFVETIKSYIQGILEMGKKTAHMVTIMTKTIVITTSSKASAKPTEKLHKL